MSSLVFLTGGARSGKSDFAIDLAERTGGPLVYLATATAGDPEMAERIRKHKESRGDGWMTVEEPLNLVEVVSGIRQGAVLVLDCITLWLTNLMMAEPEGFEETALDKARELAAALKVFNGTVVVVSNEVGMGIVPDNALSRRFRDAAGAVNRIMLEASDEAYLLVSGAPLKIKQSYFLSDAKESTKESDA